jgi:hypothetical protein
LLEAVIHNFDGGPVGLDIAVCCAVGENATRMEDVIEPYLIQQGYLQRTRARAHGHARGLAAPGALATDGTVGRRSVPLSGRAPPPDRAHPVVTRCTPGQLVIGRSSGAHWVGAGAFPRAERPTRGA